MAHNVVHLPRLPRRDVVVILASIVLITALAWLFLVHLGRQMGSAMAHGGDEHADG